MLFLLTVTDGISATSINSITPSSSTIAITSSTTSSTTASSPQGSPLIITITLASIIIVVLVIIEVIVIYGIVHNCCITARQSRGSNPEHYSTTNEENEDRERIRTLTNPLYIDYEISGAGDIHQVSLSETLYDDTVSNKNTNGRSTHAATYNETIEEEQSALSTVCTEAEYDDIKEEGNNEISGEVSSDAIYDKIKEEEISGRSTRRPTYKEPIEDEATGIVHTCTYDKTSKVTPQGNGEFTSPGPAYSLKRKEGEGKQKKKDSQVIVTLV